MYRKILVGGVTAAAVLGAGTAALATTGSDTTNGTPAANGSTASAPAHAKKGKHTLLGHAAHATVTVKTKKGYVTHDLIRGTVTSVSATSITVQAGDKVTETFVVGKDTKVVARAATKGAKPAASSIAKVTKGQHVVVAGIGTTKLAAKHIVDLGAK